MMRRFSVRIAVAVTALATALTLTGCNAVNSSAAPALSVFSGTTVPVVYKVGPGNDVVRLTVDRSREGVVLSSTLDEMELPTAWAKVTVSGTDSYLFDKKVSPTDTALFVQGGDGAYYAKQIRLGLDSGAKVLTATATSSGVIYSNADATLTLPDANLSAANQKWYWDQVSAGNYAFQDDKGVDLTGVTYPSSQLKSANAAWKAGRDAALDFIKGKVMTGADKLPLTKVGGTWQLGVDDTNVADSWALDAYLKLWFVAYTTDSGTTDTTTGATE